MECRCRRSHFTPRVWYSENGKTRFSMDKHGAVDFSPASVLGEFLKSSKLSKGYPFDKGSQHIHWAF